MKKKKEQALSNTKIAIVFLIFLTCFIAVSVLFKMIVVVRQGQFDQGKRFVISISNNKNLKVISLSPNARSIAVFKLPNISLAEALKFLEVPIEGFILSSSLDLNQKVDSLLLKSVLNYKNLKTNLTIIDLIKIFAFARTVPDSNVKIKDITVDLDTAQIDKIVGRLASDEFIEKENKTVQIINGTQVIGLGNRLARLITNIGGNVIIVATSDSPKRKSTISYIGKKTYTVERLHKFLGYDVIEENNALSDITITIGEDKVNSAPF